MYGEGLRLIACWDCGFESRRGTWFSVSCECVLCQVEVSATGRSSVQRSPSDCGCGIVCDVETSVMRRTWPALG
jgi:hypothetical protein